jgi:hypothetical protein
VCCADDGAEAGARTTTPARPVPANDAHPHDTSDAHIVADD